MTVFQELATPVPTRLEVNNLSSLLRGLAERTEGETVSMKEMLDAIGRRSYGPILLLLGFVAVSPLTIIPGSTWLIALMTLLIAGQIIIGRPVPWLPSRILKVEFPRTALVKGIETITPYVAGVDRILKPRLAFLTEAPFVQAVALVCIVAALITFPLGFIPLAPMLPGLTIFLFGLALTARDGFVVIASIVFLVAAISIVAHFAERLAQHLPGFLVS
jgi:hypothetical protein